MKKILATIFILFLGVAAYSQTAIVIGDQAKMYSVPSAKGTVRKVLAKKATVNVIRQKGPWFKVQTSDTVGWVHGNAIALTPAGNEMRLTRLTRIGSSDTGGRVDAGGTGDVGVGYRETGGSSSDDAPPPPPKSLPKTISGGVLNGKAISLPRPEYPAAARAVHTSGAVSVQVLIDEAGDVISASAVSGHPLLRAAAVSAARQSQFPPTLLSGQPVKVSGIITYNFLP